MNLNDKLMEAAHGYLKADQVLRSTVLPASKNWQITKEKEAYREEFLFLANPENILKIGKALRLAIDALEDVWCGMENGVAIRPEEFAKIELAKINTLLEEE